MPLLTTSINQTASSPLVSRVLLSYITNSYNYANGLSATPPGGIGIGIGATFGLWGMQQVASIRACLVTLPSSDALADLPDPPPSDEPVPPKVSRHWLHVSRGRDLHDRTEVVETLGRGTSKAQQRATVRSSAQ